MGWWLMGLVGAFLGVKGVTALMVARKAGAKESPQRLRNGWHGPDLLTTSRVVAVYV